MLRMQSVLKTSALYAKAYHSNPICNKSKPRSKYYGQ